jgi:type VI secretion system protein ImpF
MADLNPRDRLTPFLLDRLADDEPGTQKESRERNVLSPQQLRASILRDITWLFNTPAPVPGDGLEEFPQVMQSVLNYGVPDLTGNTGSSVRPASLERGFLKALQLFEPRLSKHGLVVQVKEDLEAPNVIALTIAGEVLANQLPERMYIKTEVDLELGQVKLKETTASG